MEMIKLQKSCYMILRYTLNLTFIQVVGHLGTIEIHISEIEEK